MAGLIMGGIGQGIANAGNAIGSIGVRDYEMRQAHALREDERQNHRDWQEQQKQDQRDWQAGQNEIYRRTAAQQTAGKGTGGDGISGFDPKDLEPGGKLSPYMAARVGMSTEDYEKQVTAMKTKDMSGYATETRDIGKVLDDEYGEQTVTQKVVPEAFKKEFAAKAKVISDLVMNYAAGKEAKTIAEGEQIGLVTGAVKGVLEGTGDVTRAYQAGGIVKGNDRFKEGGGVVVETATGTNKATPVGQATIGEKNALAKQAEAGATENAAQAGTAKALADKYRAEIPKLQAEVLKITKEAGQVGVDKATHERLSSIINSANATVTALQNTSKGNTADSKAAWDKQLAEAEALRQKAIALQTGALDLRSAPAAEKPAAEKPAAKLNALPTGAKYVGMSKGKKVYELPGGSRYIEP